MPHQGVEANHIAHGILAAAPGPLRLLLFEDEGDAALDRLVDLRRTGEAPIMEGRLDLTLEEARFLRRLGRNE